MRITIRRKREKFWVKTAVNWELQSFLRWQPSRIYLLLKILLLIAPRFISMQRYFVTCHLSRRRCYQCPTPLWFTVICSNQLINAPAELGKHYSVADPPAENSLFIGKFSKFLNKCPDLGLSEELSRRTPQTFRQFKLF